MAKFKLSVADSTVGKYYEGISIDKQNNSHRQKLCDITKM